MPGEYEKAVSIEHAISQIDSAKYLLPAIQRNFVWSDKQICVLFDSIMRDYPINSFMFWKVASTEVAQGFRFYTILKNYVERFDENNPSIDTRGFHDPFYAVIDGQQRLTSLYIGLKGTYASKLPRVWWPKAYDSSVLPKRRLFLNLMGPLPGETDEDLMEYEFKFLTEQDALRENSVGKAAWFEVGNVLDLQSVRTGDEVFQVVVDFLMSIGQQANTFARRALQRLYFAVRIDATINYYLEDSQSIDHVLDIFIRTNKGGTPLSFSDLLMSITMANWEEARESVDELVNQIRVDLGFSINRDFVMKAAIMLTGPDVRFKVKNFDAESVARFRDAWGSIRESTLEAFKLVGSFGLNDSSLRAKNAVIPIIYYLFQADGSSKSEHGRIYKTINNPIRHQNDRKAIRQWLYMSLLRGVFGFAGDALLASLRDNIRMNLDDNSSFPLQPILEAYSGTTRDLAFDAEFIERLLKTQKDDPTCYSILALMQPGLDFTQALHVDHLHPADSFSSANLDKLNFANPARRAFFDDRENWNGIANLQLLGASENTSKQHKSLEVWYAQQHGRTLVDPLIPRGADLSIDAFPEFVEARTAHLRSLLEALVGRTTI